MVGLVLQVGDAEKLPHALGLESLDQFFKVGEQSPCFTTIEKGGGNKRLVRLEPAYKADGIVPPDPVFSLATAAIAEAILMRTSAEQVPSLQRVAPRYLKLSPPLTSGCSF